MISSLRFFSLGQYAFLVVILILLIIFIPTDQWFYINDSILCSLSPLLFLLGSLSFCFSCLYFGHISTMDPTSTPMCVLHNFFLSSQYFTDLHACTFAHTYVDFVYTRPYFVFSPPLLKSSGLGRIHRSLCDYVTVFPALPLLKVAYS